MDTKEAEITIDECRKFIDSLDRFCSDPIELHIIGGESLIKRGILELVSHIRENGSRVVITSCGYTIDEAMAKAIVGSGLSMLNLSLDSLNPKVHNFLRGRDDCFQRVMSAIDHLSRYRGNKMKLGVNSIISGHNLRDIIGLAEWVDGNKSLDSIYFMAVMRPFGSQLGWDWFKKEEYGYLWPQDYSEAADVLDGLIDLKKQGYKIENSLKQLEVFKMYFKNPLGFIKERRCNVAQQAVNINALGDIYLCFFKDKLGNIRRDSIPSLWSSPLAETIRKEMLSCRSNCELVVNCYYEDD